MSFADGVARVYVDGALAASDVLSFDAGASSEQTPACGAIGAEETGSVGFFTGALDELRVGYLAFAAEDVLLESLVEDDAFVTVLPTGTP
jgi:hypothetical protein